MNIECQECFAWFDRDELCRCPLCGWRPPRTDYTPPWAVADAGAALCPGCGGPLDAGHTGSCYGVTS